MEYKVIALSVGGRGNKIFNSGDIVTDKNFIDGRAEKLVELGFLKRIEKPLVKAPEVLDQPKVEKPQDNKEGHTTKVHKTFKKR